MVFFTCNNCGESLKKNVVEKHNFRCRMSQGVTCMDCHKLFQQDYVSHTSCVTEQEKYGGQGYVGKEAKNMKRQEQWVEKLIEAWKNDVSTKYHFNKFFYDSSKLQNIPRNLKKLENYFWNSAKMPKPISEKFKQVASCVMESLNQERIQKQEEEKQKSVIDQNEFKRKIEHDENLPSKKFRVEKVNDKLSEINKGETENNVEVSVEKKSTKKHKKKVVANGNTQENGDFKMNKENESVDEVEENGHSTEFKWKSSIKNTLRSNNSKMKIKKLQKIIVGQYLSYVGNEDCAEEAKELFHKKINNNNKFIILDDKYIQLK